MAIEGCFGEFINRWGLLHRPLLVDRQRWAPLLFCLAHLHNHCIEAGFRADSRIGNRMRPVQASSAIAVRAYLYSNFELHTPYLYMAVCVLYFAVLFSNSILKVTEFSTKFSTAALNLVHY